MEFKYCIVGNILYGKDSSEKKEPKTKEEILSQNNPAPSIDLNKQKHIATPIQHEHSIFTFKDDMLMGIINNCNDKDTLIASNMPVNYTIQSNDKKKKLTLKT